MKDRHDDWTRRDFAGVVALAGLAALAPKLARAETSGSVGEAGPSEVPPAFELGEATTFMGLRPRRRLGAWTIGRVRRVDGTTAVELIRGGHRVQIDIARRGGALAGAHETRNLALFVHDDDVAASIGGREDAARTLAAYLREAERRYDLDPHLRSFDARAPGGIYRLD